MAAKVSLSLEVQGDDIVVTLPGTSYVPTYYRAAAFPQQLLGDTGIGTERLPKMRPEIALWGWAVVKRDGKVVSPMAPAHVMVTSSGPARYHVGNRYGGEDALLYAERLHQRDVAQD